MLFLTFFIKDISETAAPIEKLYRINYPHIVMLLMCLRVCRQLNTTESVHVLLSWPFNKPLQNTTPISCILYTHNERDTAQCCHVCQVERILSPKTPKRYCSCLLHILFFKKLSSLLR
uniref:Uncharacterized protein n=1 Tax=Cacopsylla melanoneura TaxID=428564 RepID=A0A8D8YZY7_9HEMI